ncbi:conserved hypothetical protein [Leishmania major strain Friedlin]|uniref:C3H1-type domain-containing protein n=1 Tax=Leishmania major TaxID=5664 RepID=E9AFZ3_LEIMA|nr:conserved hypothetical protein [Leishmania major strain Friedlin]CAG9582876.1 Zinc_finger_C-x8-C-x5-C-x3-H_type_(and_similar)_-_putative [Leishmania major strain Friedlin]CBZ13148.1 conserved hypothetical protein [Leishmania major strain Friedlin]|eukprot:XP_003722913.1 conserved hypothetical protein [Leishmania major strain Friedlin]
MSQQQWTPDQRRQQIAEMLRNKGVICRDFLFTGRCSRSPTCPYMHVANGETRPVPWSVCTFFTQGKCLRDGCSFFHGTQAQLEELHASGAPVYRPQDYMKIAVPPAEYLNADGSIATHLSIAAVPMTPALHVVHGPTVSHENAVNSFQPVLVMQPNSQAIAPTMFASQGRTAHSTPSHFAFYANAPITSQMPTHSAATVLQPTLHTVQPTTFYQAANALLAQPQQHFAPVPQLNTPQQHQLTQQALGSRVYFHIQPH